MDAHKKGWFTEIGAPKGQNVALSILAKNKLHEETSKYQKILVFESELFGKCLALDDAIQCTDMDEFSYQEMIAFLPLNCHVNPKKILIIGGGDGGVAREVLKHPMVEEVVQCEIDERVVELSKIYFPSMAESYKNPKMKVVIGDGYKYLQELDDGSYDVIITDSSDPKGPAACLFERPYYELLYRKLRQGGIVCCQAESIWFDLGFIKNLLQVNRTIFGSVAYASTMTCTYPSGQIGFLICCKDKSVNFKIPLHVLDEEKLNLKYYSKDVHQSAFILPRFVCRTLYNDQQ